MNKYINLSRSILAASTILIGAVFVSCEDDLVDPTFSIDNIDLSSYEINVDYKGLGIATTGYINRSTANKYVVRSNTSWQLVPQGEDTDWLVMHPAKGDKDGTFYLAVKPNTSYYTRELDLAIEIDGDTNPEIIHVTQTGSSPYLNTNEKVVIRGNGGDCVLSISANLNWTYEHNDPDCNWLTVVGADDSQINLSVSANESETLRSTSIEILSEDCPELNKTITITQYGASLIFYDDFEYLSGSNMTSWYDTSNQLNMLKWTDTQLAEGWSSWYDTYFDSNASSGDNCTLAPSIYKGTYEGNTWVKLGKGSWCGNLVSPPLSSLADGETVDVIVSFCACPYRTEGTATSVGKLDTNLFMVGVYGPGEVVNSNYVMKDVNVKYIMSGETVSKNKMSYAKSMAAVKSDMSGDYKVKKFTLNNYPPGLLEDFNYYENPLDPEHAYTLRINGVTNKSQIVFFGGGYDYFNAKSDSKITVVGKSGAEYIATRVNKCNRIFLDNVMVNIVK